MEEAERPGVELVLPVNLVAATRFARALKPASSAETSGLQESAGDDPVPRLVRVLVRPARRCHALPGPLADQGYIARDLANPGHRHLIAEVSGIKGTGYIRDPGAGLGVDLLQHVVIAGGQPLADPAMACPGVPSSHSASAGR